MKAAGASRRLFSCAPSTGALLGARFWDISVAEAFFIGRGLRLRDIDVALAVGRPSCRVCAGAAG